MDYLLFLKHQHFFIEYVEMLKELPLIYKSFFWTISFDLTHSNYKINDLTSDKVLINCNLINF